MKEQPYTDKIPDNGQEGFGKSPIQLIAEIYNFFKLPGSPGANQLNDLYVQARDAQYELYFQALLSQLPGLEALARQTSHAYQTLEKELDKDLVLQAFFLPWVKTSGLFVDGILQRWIRELELVQLTLAAPDRV
ncbi:MAG: hypothetical protein QNK37_05145 [Acidobacteriota bacterium]|nr:hypothetical protein [Acidobacteriota bacterium]